jgi:hypothetical protein
MIAPVFYLRGGILSPSGVGKNSPPETPRRSPPLRGAELTDRLPIRPPLRGAELTGWLPAASCAREISHLRRSREPCVFIEPSAGLSRCASP